MFWHSELALFQIFTMGVKYILSSREVYSPVRLIRAVFLKVYDNNTPFVTLHSFCFKSFYIHLPF